jgi:hypothetical protein
MDHIIISTEDRVAEVQIKNWIRRLPPAVACETISVQPFILKVVIIDPLVRENTAKDTPKQNKKYEKFLRVSLSQYIRDMKKVSIEVC